MVYLLYTFVVPTTMYTILYYYLYTYYFSIKLTDTKLTYHNTTYYIWLTIPFLDFHFSNLFKVQKGPYLWILLLLPPLTLGCNVEYMILLILRVESSMHLPILNCVIALILSYVWLGPGTNMLNNTSRKNSLSVIRFCICYIFPL